MNFEYKTIRADFFNRVSDDVLCSYGKDGWELISLDKDNSSINYTFKRQVDDKEKDKRKD